MLVWCTCWSEVTKFGEVLQQAFSSCEVQWWCARQLVRCNRRKYRLIRDDSVRWLIWSQTSHSWVQVVCWVPVTEFWCWRDLHLISGEMLCWDYSVYLWFLLLFDLHSGRGTLICTWFLCLNSYLQDIVLENLSVTELPTWIWLWAGWMVMGCTWLWIGFFLSVFFGILLFVVVVVGVDLEAIVLVGIHLFKQNYKEKVIDRLHNIVS